MGLTPFVVFAALAGIALLLGVLAWPETATLAFVALLYTNAPVALSNTLGLPPVFASFAIVLLVVPFLGAVILRRQPFVLTAAAPLLLLYLLALVVATLFSSYVAAAANNLFLFLTEGLLLFFLVTNAIRKPATVRRVLWVLLIAGGAMGGLSIVQELTHSYGNSYLGFAQVQTQGFLVEDTSQVLRPRLAGPIGEENRYAQILLVLVPIGLTRIWGERQRALRLLGALMTILIVGGILLTFSRGATVGLAVIVLAMVVLREIGLRRLTLIGLALAVALVAIAPDYLVRIQSLTGVEGLVSQDAPNPDSAIVGRTTSNLAAFNTFFEHPLVGVGPGQYVAEYSARAGNELGLRYFYGNRRAHNLYLEIAADTGILGLLAFLAIVFATMRGLLSMRRFWRDRDAGHANLATALLLALVGYLASGLFLHLAYERYFWVLVAIAASTYWSLHREAAARSDFATAPVSLRAPSPASPVAVAPG